MADANNPFLSLDMMQMLQPNPYTQYNERLPIPGFRGVATDAQGKPIPSDVAAIAQSQQGAPASAPAQGTTLNSTPAPQVQTSGSWPGQAQGAAAPGSLMATPAMQEMQAGIAAAQAAKSPQQLAIEAQNNTMRQQMLQQQADQTAAANAGGGFGRMPGGAFNPGPGYTPTPAAPAAPAPSAAPAPAPPTTNGVDLRQSYLDALANPGPVTTPGATVPQSRPLGTPSVLASFLAAHPSGGGTGAGAYDNRPFFDTLNRLGTA